MIDPMDSPRLMVLREYGTVVEHRPEPLLVRTGRGVESFASRAMAAGDSIAAWLMGFAGVLVMIWLVAAALSIHTP